MDVVNIGKKTKEDLNTEYAKWCARLGDLHYKIQCFQGEINFISDKLKELNEESLKLDKENHSHERSDD